MVITQQKMSEAAVRELLQQAAASQERAMASQTATTTASVDRAAPEQDQPVAFPWYRTRSEAHVLHDPRPGARVVVILPADTRVRVSGMTENYFEVRSVAGGLNGYVLESELERISP